MRRQNTTANMAPAPTPIHGFHTPEVTLTVLKTTTDHAKRCDRMAKFTNANVKSSAVLTEILKKSDPHALGAVHTSYGPSRR